MALLEELQRKKGLASLFLGKGGERIKPRPTTQRPLEPIPFRPTIPPEEEPYGPIGPRPPGISIGDKIRKLQMQKKQLQRQIANIDAQIRSLSGQEGGQPPIPWGPGGPPPPPLNPPTIVRPPTIGPGTPIPQPPTAPIPWKPDPPWGG